MKIETFVNNNLSYDWRHKNFSNKFLQKQWSRKRGIWTKLVSKLDKWLHRPDQSFLTELKHEIKHQKQIPSNQNFGAWSFSDSKSSAGKTRTRERAQCLQRGEEVGKRPPKVRNKTGTRAGFASFISSRNVDITLREESAELLWLEESYKNEIYGRAV